MDHNAAVRAALRVVHERYAPLFAGLPFEELHATWSGINNALWEEYATGSITPVELQMRRAQGMIDWAAGRCDAGRDCVPEASEVSELHIGCYVAASRAYDGVVPMLRSLKERYTLGIITNSFIAEPKLVEAEIDSYFDHVILSEDVGVQKPDRRIFQVALDAAGVEPEAMLYVGDDLFCDIEGAARAGLRTIWFNERNRDPRFDSYAVQPDAIARSVHDLASLLGVMLDPTPTV